MRCKVIFFILSTVCLGTLKSQHKDTLISPIAGMIFLDSIVVSAGKFQAEEFIDFVMNDQSLYDAFKNLRSMPHVLSTRANITRGQRKKLLTHNSLLQQFNQGNCREMKELSMENKGKWRKANGSHLYYTLELIDRLFWTHGKVCSSEIPQANQKSNESRIDALKKLIFNPGIPAKIPLVGKRLAIFDDKNLIQYQYRLTADTQQSKDIYLFTVELNPFEKSTKPDKMIIRKMETWFNNVDFQVVRRRYHLLYSHLLANCDITLDVIVQSSNEVYYPSLIIYQGSWNIPGKKREEGNFTITVNPS